MSLTYTLPINYYMNFEIFDSYGRTPSEENSNIDSMDSCKTVLKTKTLLKRKF